MLTNYLLIIFCLLALFCSFMVIASKNPIHSILYLILVFCNVTFVLILLGVEFIAIIFLIVYVGAIAVLFLFVVMMLNIKILELDEVFWRYIPAGLLISSCFLFQLFAFVFNFSIVEVFSLFLNNGFYSVHKLSSGFPEIHPLPSLLVNGIYIVPILPDFQITDHSVVSIATVIYKNDSFFCFVKLNEFSVNLLNLSFEITNTEILGWLIYTYTFFIFLVISLILLISMIGSIVLVLNQNINIKRQVIFRQSLRDLKTSVSLKN
jgi:NADH-ubiquinone oxidoreductase chain 6